MKIEPATADDLDRLVAIENAAFDPALYPRISRRQFRRHLNSDRAILLVARNRRGMAVGYGLGLVSRATPYVRFYSLAVDPETQNGRVGGQLIRAMEAVARERGSPGMRCEVRADKEKLLRSYARIGYLPYGREAGFYSDGASCVKLQKELSPVRRRGGK